MAQLDAPTEMEQIHFKNFEPESQIFLKILPLVKLPLFRSKKWGSYEQTQLSLKEERKRVRQLA